jgi:hypothetical protein
LSTSVVLDTDGGVDVAAFRAHVAHLVGAEFTRWKRPKR